MVTEMNWLYNTLTNIWMRLEYSIGYKAIQHMRLKNTDYRQLDAMHAKRKSTPFLWIQRECLYEGEPEGKELRLPPWSHDCPWW